MTVFVCLADVIGGSDGKMEVVTTAQESYTGTMSARQGLAMPADKLRIGEAGAAFEVSCAVLCMCCRGV